MWVNTLDPVFLSIGPVQIRYYGLVYFFGALLAYFMLDRARKKGTLTLTEDEVSDFVLWLVAGMLVGARVFEVLVFSLPYYMSQPWWKVFALWEGGMSFHGGFVGIVIAAYWFCRRKKLNFWTIADLLSPPLMFALFLGRIANFINGELWGKVTSVSWCVVFPPAGEACRHPYPLYEALKRLGIFAWLIVLGRKECIPGVVFWNLVFFEGLGRFVLDFFKEDIIYLWLTPGQWLSLGMVAVSGYFLIKSLKKVDSE